MPMAILACIFNVGPNTNQIKSQLRAKAPVRCGGWVLNEKKKNRELSSHMILEFDITSFNFKRKLNSNCQSANTLSSLFRQLVCDDPKQQQLSTGSLARIYGTLISHLLLMFQVISIETPKNTLN